MRKQIIAGNWKMNMHIKESVDFATELVATLPNKDVEIILYPPFTAIHTLATALNDSPITVGAQNVASVEKGAYTGEVAASMLVDAGAKSVIIGHSERRIGFHESSAVVRDKIKMALAHGLEVILCVGEAWEIREEGNALSFIATEVEESLANTSAEELCHLSIAYEPIWAIGTGRTATAEEAEEVCASIREKIAMLYGRERSDALRILYGGSVKGSNAKEILGKPNIDGALVGGASLIVEDFIAIIEGASE